MGLGGVTVSLSGMGDAQTTTDDSGGYEFSGLRAGTYSVEISSFDTNEVSFSSTSGAATVGVGETKVVPFDGTYVRTAGIQGQVSVEGVGGIPGVTVTLVGEGEDRTEVTNAAGQYSFSRLKSGTYQVAITNPDPEDYEFATTSKSATVATGETANVPFEGTLLRTAGISGRVSVGDMGLNDVTVNLAGAEERKATTSNGGQYSFAGLAAGTYVLSITNPNPTAYNFPEDQLQQTVVLEDGKAENVNFLGTHTRTAMISGVLFIDEMMQDEKRNDGEPSITEAIAPLVAAGALDQEVVADLLAKAKVTLRGPDLNDETDIAIMPDGTFSTGASLMAGSYQLELPANDKDVRDGLDAAGVRFVGESMVVMVEAGGSETADFPFRITMQTVSVGAVMGNREKITDPPLPVSDVALELYPTAEDAEDGTNMLGERTTAGLMDENNIPPGMAVFSFARADDTNPAGEATDNLVFVKVVGHHDDLSVSDNPIIEIEYPGVSRLHAAPAHVRLLNTAVRFQFWVKSDMEARSGNMPLEGWHTQVFMGEITDDSEPLMKPDPEDDTKMVNLTDPTEGDEEEGEELGRAMVSYAVDTDDLPAAFTVVVSPDTDDWAQPMAMGETWEEVGDDRLMHTHTGFELPATNTHEMNDLMATYVKFSTQTLKVGVYREADDVAGFSDFQSRVTKGDHRPAADVAKELSVSVMVTASGRRGLEVYDEWDQDRDPDTDPIDATITGLTGGMATFVNLPADMEFTVQFNEGSNRVAVGGPDSRSDRVQTYGADLEIGSRSKGAFGEMSGAGPEVEVCPLTTDTRPSSLGDEDSDCATFAYQWKTGSITGAIGRAVKDLDVSIEADTDVHSEAPRDTETDKDGKFDWSSVQDGVYSIAVASSDEYTFTPKSVRVDVYHDEFEDDKNEDTKYVGTAGTDHAKFTGTRLRLSIKGYAANVAHETDDRVRLDETYPGAELEIYAYDKDSEAKIKKKGKVLGTATVGDDGLYEFNDLDDTGSYTIVAKNTDDYEMYATGPNIHYRNNIKAMTYRDVGEEDLMLPKWDYAASTVTNPTSTHDLDPDDTESPTFTFYNFVLLHGDGDFTGRVYEARGEPGGIAVELRRCETYTKADATATPPVEESCREDTGFSAETENADSRGRWDFASLREGWYAVNIAATTYNRAKWDAKYRIDDDATDCDGTADTDDDRTNNGTDDCDGDRTEDMFGMLEGLRAFNRGGATFYVYNRTLDDESAIGDVVVKGTTNVDAGEATLGGSPLDGSTVTAGSAGSIGSITDAVTYATRSINIEPNIPSRATFVATVTTGSGTTLKTIDKVTGEGGDDVDLTVAGNKTNASTGAAVGTALENTVTIKVVAENGYHDTEGTFTVSVTDPVDAQLTALTFGTTRAGTDGGLTFDAGDDQQTATVPVGTGSGTTMSLFIRVTGKALQEGIEVTHNGNGLTALTPQSAQGAQVHDYRITIPKEGDLQGQEVNITVTSQDEVDFNYEIRLRR